MKHISDRKANRCRPAVSFFIHPSTFFILLLILCIGISTVFAQEPERIAIDGSSLHAGEAFRFTVTVNSDEMLSFAEAQTQLTAVLCPVNQASGSCQTLTQSAEGTDDTTMRITFTAEALPAAGDYTLEISFVDSTGTFAAQTGSYLITGVQESSGEETGITPTPTGTPTETVTEIPITVKPVTLFLSVLDAEGSSLPYGATLYVNLPYTLRIKADSAMNDSVMVSAALPASLQSAPLDPQSECMQFLNAEGNALEIPGSLWTGENNATFACEFRYSDRVWLPGEAVVFSLEAQDADENETYSMQPLKWNSYPVNITQRSATHQAQISDSRGNLICSDTVHCGMFYSDEVYILTYKFPADWGAVLPSGETFTADVTWPAEWAGSMRQPQNQETASAFGSPCEIDENGMTHFVLNETGQGRYSASCSFNPGAVTNAVQPSILIHLNDNSWAVRDLTVGLSPVIIRQTAVPTETPVPTEEVLPPETPVPTEEPTEVPTEELTEEPIQTEPAEPTEALETLMPETPEGEAPTETPLPEIEITMTVKPITLSPSIVDESGNVLIYGSTLYVGETYYLQIHSDSAMNNSVSVDVALPASLLSAPLDPASGCLSYLNMEGTALSIPGSNWNADNGSTFRCELRFLDSIWLAANPFNFSLDPTGISADETYEMTPLSWNYYPVNIARYSATQQLQITDSRGTLICSDNVPCGMFNADDVYTITYKFPADYSAALPSGRSFSADLRWPDNWGLGLQMANDVETASQFGEACSVGPDGMTHFELTETAEGRYSASCTFTPGAIASPSAAAASVHLNDNSFQVTDLNILLPANIIKRQASLSPSLTVQIVEGYGEIEQIQGGSVGRLYRTTADMPNNGGGFGAPALYTLKAQIEGVSEIRSPQWGDHVLVNWSVLDALAMTGDLPTCLVPDGNGYQLGTLSQTDTGSWYADCSFRFPLSMSTDTAGGSLRMELVSGMYNTSSVVNVAAQPFTKQTLAVNLDVPETMVLNQPMEIRASLSDDSGALSDYTRAVLSQMGANLSSEWEYNYATSCQGVYDLSESGESSCVVEFNYPTDADSMMHFELTSPGLTDLFNVSYRPGADIPVAKISRVDVTVSPSLALRMTPDGGESEQIGGGWIGALYRTAGDMPNAAMSYDLPALYTLRASVSGVFGGSQPQPDDYILVNWNVLDELALSGNLPDCLSPEQGGYRLGMLEQSGETDWSASCEFYFPQVMNTGLTGGPMSMELVSMAYQGSASAQMNGNTFRQDNLYIDVDVPRTMVLNQPMEIKARVSDDTGSLSDYARAVLSRTGASLYSDWAYNYVTDCQGVYDLSETGEAVCGFRFDYATDADSNMHFELTSPGLTDLFNVSYRPGADIPVAKISRVDVTVSPSLALRMTPDGGESEQIGGGWIGALYRTAGDMPNAAMSYDLPALYTLRASVSGVFGGSQPQPDDYIQVNWSLLDELAVSGNLPLCLTPAAEGYQLGTLEQTGETEWSASCDFYFPQSLPENLSGNISIQMVSGAYQGAANVQMNGNAFKRENLYVDLDIPEHMLVHQMTEFRAKVSDDSGSLSEYTRAVLNAAGATLRSDWIYNYVTTCQGLYDLEMDGSTSCSALFEAPSSGDSTMHFELESPALENLFDVTYRPGTDIHIAEVSYPSAQLSVKLFHGGAEIPLPASADDAFLVGEDYQFQFYLTPDEEYRDVLNAVSVDNEGLVIDWWEPLRIHWGMLPNGETSLNFYRDGENFIARYDFSFAQGGLTLDGIMGELVAECWIDGWEINGINDMVPIQLPSRIAKKPLTLGLSGFVSELTGTGVQDVYADQTVGFDVTFSGEMQYFDSTQLIVGYDANGIRTMIDCSPNAEGSSLHCSFVPQCTDFTVDSYPSVCGTNLRLFAEYNGDTYNDAAEAESRIFNVKRGEIYFVPESEGSLSQFDLYSIQNASPDLQYFADSGIRCGDWTVESFLPREILRNDGVELKSYPVVFGYTTNASGVLDDSLLRLDVKFQTGSSTQPQDDVISLRPRSVTSDKILFELDFSSREMLDDGRTAYDALQNAVTITGLEIRYPGSPLMGPASASYQAEKVTFALKVATLLDADMDISMPGTVRFGGAAAAEMQMRPFDVYCSQLYQELQCSAELPLDVLNDNGEPMLSEVVPDGCWGRIRTTVGRAEIYVNNSVYPQCYLSAVDENGRLMIAGEF